MRAKKVQPTQQPATKKRRGRINSSNLLLRNQPATSTTAYNLVEEDENERVRKQSDKVRARLERERQKKDKDAALIEAGVKLKDKLLAMPVKSVEMLTRTFTVNDLKALIAAYAHVPKGKKAELAQQLATILAPQQGTTPLLLMDRR